jgi:hypothetical protein
MIKTFLAFIVLITASLLYSTSSMAQIYGTWGAEATSASIVSPYLPSTQVSCTNTASWPAIAATHGHPNYLGMPVGNVCLITQPITMRYFYKTGSIGSGLQRRCFLKYYKQQCLQ